MSEESSSYGDELSQRDLEFMSRVFDGDLSRYERRIKRIGFHQRRLVLDVGCGFGQWTAALAKSNDVVLGLDMSMARVEVASEMLVELDSSSSSYVLAASMNAIPLRSGVVDAIFCYSALFASDPLATLRELARVAAPGCLLYVCTNGVGWYLSLISEGKNGTGGYDPVAVGRDAIVESVRYFASGVRGRAELAIPSSTLVCWLEQAGFIVDSVGSEGTLGDAQAQSQSFFPATFGGDEAVYEVLARRELS